MNPNSQSLIVAGALLAFLGVGLGAFGAHALKARLAPDLLAVYQTGVQYHLWHALGIVLIGLLVQSLPGQKLLPIAGWLMVAGIILFSGSLYALSISGVRALGAVTPIGGVAFLASWAMVAWSVWQARA